MLVATQNITAFTTTSLNNFLFLEGGIYQYGFTSGQPCIAISKAVGMDPTLSITQKTGLMLNLEGSIDLKCKKKAYDEEFS